MKGTIKAFLIITYVYAGILTLAALGSFSYGDYVTAFYNIGIAAVSIPVSIIAHVKLGTATCRKDLRGIAILTLIFGNMIAGILMLCIPDSALAENATKNNPANPYNPYNPYNQPYDNPYQSPYGAPYNPNGQYQNPNGQFQNPNGQFQNPNGQFQNPNGQFQNPYQQPYNPNPQQYQNPYQQPYNQNPQQYQNPYNQYQNPNNYGSPYGNPNGTPFTPAQPEPTAQNEQPTEETQNDTPTNDTPANEE